MNICIATFVLSLIPAGAQVARGQATPELADPGGGFTVEELVTRALQQNGDVLAIRQRVASARGGLTQARLRANPSVELNAMKEATRSDNSFMVGGSLPLELFGRRDRRVEVAAGNVRMSEFEEAERERLLRSEVESKFGEVLALLRNLRFAEDLLNLNRKALELTQARVDKGSAAQLDANLLRVEVNRIDALRVEFEGRMEGGVLELKSLVGMKPQDDLHLQGTLTSPQLPVDAEDKAALQLRPDLLSMRASEQMAEARLKQAQTDGRADASLSANYQRIDSGFDVNGFDSRGQLRRVQGIFHDLTVGVTVQLPVRNRNQGSIEAAAAQLEEAHIRKNYAALVAAREIAVARLSYQKARQSLDIYERGVRGQASENLNVIRKVYELGRTQLLDVIAEQRRFIEVETGYTEALRRYYQAGVRLRTALGRNAS